MFRRRVALVVDDDHATRALLGQILEEEEGYEVLLAEDGDEAMRLLASPAELDLLLTDLEMPGRSGLEVIELARRERPRLAIILLTAFPDAEIEARALRLGTSAVVAKPFPLADLLRTVDETTRLRP